MQRAAIFSGGDFLIRLLGLLKARSRVRVMTQCSLGLKPSSRVR